MNPYIGLSFLVANVLINGCLQPREKDMLCDQHEVSIRYADLLNHPSEEKLLDLLISSTKERPDEELLVQLQERLTLSDHIVFTSSGVAYTDHTITVACLSAMLGDVVRTDELPVVGILSRQVEGIIYRYHLYAIDTDRANLISQITSAWLDGYITQCQERDIKVNKKDEVHLLPERE